MSIISMVKCEEYNPTKFANFVSFVLRTKN